MFFAVVVAIAAVLALVAARLSREDRIAVVPPPPLPASSRSTIAAQSVTSDSNALNWSRAASLTSQLANPLLRTENFSSLYDRFAGSTDGLERAIAHRAWAACFPTFMSSDGQQVPLQQFARAMPQGAPGNAARLLAYAELQKRCQGFFYLSPDEIANATRRQDDAANRGDALLPGELALKYFLEGRNDEAVQIARKSVQSADPYVIASLQDLVHRMVGRNIEEQTAAKGERSDLRGLAFALAACDLGLDCASQSLIALQLCTNNGACEGTVVDRYLSALPNAADRELALKESKRTLALIREGNLDGLGFALPPR